MLHSFNFLISCRWSQSPVLSREGPCDHQQEIKKYFWHWVQCYTDWKGWTNCDWPDPAVESDLGEILCTKACLQRLLLRWHVLHLRHQYQQPLLHRILWPKNWKIKQPDSFVFWGRDCKIKPPSSNGSNIFGAYILGLTSRFKWVHLSERLAYEAAVRQQRLRTEISQVSNVLYYASQRDIYWSKLLPCFVGF